MFRHTDTHKYTHIVNESTPGKKADVYFQRGVFGNMLNAYVQLLYHSQITSPLIENNTL